MSVKNTSGTVFIRENTLLPVGLTIETEFFLPGWRVVRNLDGYGLGRKIEEAKWNFFYLAGDLTSLALGREGSESLRRAVSRVLVKPGGEQFNSLEITNVVSKWFFVVPYTKVTAHFRHIQEGVGLVERGKASPWRTTSSPNRETLVQHTVLITGS